MRRFAATQILVLGLLSNFHSAEAYETFDDGGLHVWFPAVGRSNGASSVLRSAILRSGLRTILTRQVQVRFMRGLVFRSVSI